MCPDTKPSRSRSALLLESAFVLGYLSSLVLALDRRDRPLALQAENRFLRAQLAMYVSRSARPKRTTPFERMALMFHALFFDWRGALVVVKPATFIRWHRNLARLQWAFLSRVFAARRRTGRPPLSDQMIQLILRIASENAIWSPARIARELDIKFGLHVSPRTIAKYLDLFRRGSGRPKGQSWRTLLGNHSAKIVACDFATVTTLAFRRLYVLVVLDLETRRILHLNAPPHPTAAWTIQQLREGIPAEHAYRFLLHDHDAIFSADVDRAVKRFGLKTIRTPVRTPQANAICERAIGTMRRECLDHVIPLSESHLRRILREWQAYYNHARPHMARGCLPPDPPGDVPCEPQRHRHVLPGGTRVIARPILDGLHHDYRIAA